MPRPIYITDHQKRDAQVQMEGAKRRARWTFQANDGRAANSARFIKATENTTYDALIRKYESADALADALVSGDPEIDLEQVGRRIEQTDRVYVRADGSVLYSARVLKVVYDPSGEEQSREDFMDVEATVSDEEPLLWSGRLFDVDDVVRRFVFSRKVQLRHINGLTYDFLYQIAKHLHDGGKVLLVGAGKKGNRPLIFQTNGSPYRGFLEGRVEDDGFMLVLHLSNLELKRVTE